MRRSVGPFTLFAFTAALVGVLMAASGCAWGYAGQPNDEEGADSETDDNPNVVEMKDDSDGDGDGEAADDDTGDSETATDDGAGPTQKETSESPCAVEIFEIHYFDDTTQITREIDCTAREVVDIKRNPISQQTLRTADESGLPEGTWYLLVDPKGVRSEFLNNDQLIRISQEYDLQFLGRDDNRDLLIYEFRGDL